MFYDVTIDVPLNVQLKIDGNDIKDIVLKVNALTISDLSKLDVTLGNRILTIKSNQLKVEKVITEENDSFQKWLDSTRSERIQDA